MLKDIACFLPVSSTAPIFRGGSARRSLLSRAAVDPVARVGATAVGADVDDAPTTLRGLRLELEPGVVPALETVPEREGAVAVLAEKLRHTGASVLFRSGAIGDDRLLPRQLAPAPVDLFGRDPERAGHGHVELVPHAGGDHVE